VGLHLLGVLDPYFFEDNEGAAITVTTERHLVMLRKFYELELRRRETDPSSILFQAVKGQQPTQ
jgi:hypothetical protein